LDKIYLATYSFGFDSGLDLPGKIRKAAEIGYDGVELAGGYEGLSAAEIKSVLDEAGIECISSHVELDNIGDELPFLAELGCKFVICPMYSITSRDDVLELAAKLTELGRKAASYGLKVGYHNHHTEFWKEDGEYFLETLINNTKPEDVVFQLDCGWASAAGIDPAGFIKQYAGRFISVHIKENNKVIGVEKPKPRPKDGSGPSFELDENGKPIIPPEFLKMMEEMTRINCRTGDGIIDWKEVKAAADAQGCIAYIVEREYSYNEPKDRIQCLVEDLRYLRTNVF
jgi:sugar phosphate isomerase/epimerase